METNQDAAQKMAGVSFDVEPGLNYKDREAFVHNPMAFVKGLNIAELRDAELIELYELAQHILNGRTGTRDANMASPNSKDKEMASKLQDETITPLFEFLGTARQELEKRQQAGKLAQKGLEMPPTMEERNF